MDTKLEPRDSGAGGDDSNCSTPYVSAPSSPSRPLLAGFYHSAPTSPMHYAFTSIPARSSAGAGGLTPAVSDASSTASFEFAFSDKLESPSSEIGMSSADELFLNGQIRPQPPTLHFGAKLHRETDDENETFRKSRVPVAPLIDFRDELERESDDDENDHKSETFRKSRVPISPSLNFGGKSDRDNDENDENDEENETFRKSRVSRFRSDHRRRARSLSPLRNTTPFFSPKPTEKEETEDTPANSSAGRNSTKRWDFLKDFLRSKSEGRSNNNKFWQNISLSSPAKEKKGSPANKSAAAAGKRRSSAHEMHYAAKRAQAAAEERRKKTYLPYRQGVLVWGCLGFNSKSFGLLHGFSRALNPVSSR